MTRISFQLLLLTLLGYYGLAYEWIAGYEPFTRVTDHAAIDLDQQKIDELLKLGSIESVKSIYEKGAYSQSIARMKILNTGNLPETVLPSGTQVMGRSTSGNLVFGHVLQDLSFNSSSSEDVEILVQYPANSKANELNCRVGGLVSINSATRSGCKYLRPSFLLVQDNLSYLFHDLGHPGFTEFGQLMIMDPEMIFNYTYDSRDDTFNGRTIQQFSLLAKDEMYACQKNCPYSDFAKFVNYYGAFDYGDQWIQAAFDQKATNFDNGNVDFSVAGRGGVEGTCYSRNTRIA
jgi:hypothetical protein